MSIVHLDAYREAKSSQLADEEALADGLHSELEATEGEADLALQLADAQARITELELVLVETLKRNALNWARAQEAEAKLNALSN